MGRRKSLISKALGKAPDAKMSLGCLVALEGLERSGILLDAYVITRGYHGMDGITTDQIFVELSGASLEDRQIVSDMCSEVIPVYDGWMYTIYTPRMHPIWSDNDPPSFTAVWWQHRSVGGSMYWRQFHAPAIRINFGRRNGHWFHIESRGMEMHPMRGDTLNKQHWLSNRNLAVPYGFKTLEMTGTLAQKPFHISVDKVGVIGKEIVPQPEHVEWFGPWLKLAVETFWPDGTQTVGWRG